MNKKICKLTMLLFVTVILVCSASVVFAEGIINQNCSVFFSVNGGLYQKPFSLTLSTDLENAQIYYTTDGSDPTENSVLYNGSITIENRTSQPNDLSEISGVSTSFKAPNGLVFKGTVIKARAVNAESKTPIFVNSYFVSDDILTRYGVKVISITTERDNLFSKQNGIYMSPNYLESGELYERSAFVEVFDSDGSCQIAQPAGIRIHGGASRNYQQKSFRVYARENPEYQSGGLKTFESDLFDGTVTDFKGGIITKYKRLMLRNGGNDWDKKFIQDAFIQDICAPLDFDTQGYRPSVAFINGEFWGMYDLRERYDDQYFRYHYKLNDNKDVAMLKMSSEDGVRDILTLEEGEEQYLNEYLEHYNWILENNLKVPDNYETACKYFDPSNMIDYVIANVYFKNWDWPQNNVVIWKNTNPQNDFDDRWRFAILDNDYTLEANGKLNTDNILENRIYGKDQPSTSAKGWKLSQLFAAFLENDDFRNETIRRYNDYMNTIFDKDILSLRLDEMYNNISHLVAEQKSRYPLSMKNDNRSSIKSQINSRETTARNEMKETWGVHEMVNALFISDLSKGYIKVNNIELCSNNKWQIKNPGNYSAQYYKNIPIEINAVAENGYKFSYFLINGQKVYDSCVNLDMSVDETVETIFEKTETAKLISDSIVIYQVFGDGGKTDAIMDRSCVQLYNPLDVPVDISGYALQYSSTVGDGWQKFVMPENSVIKPKHFYLIGGKLNSINARIKIDADIYFDDMVIDNKMFKLALTKNSEDINAKATTAAVIDLLGVVEKNGDSSIDAYETVPSYGLSKQKSLIRVGFDTGNNQEDFAVFSFKDASDEEIKEKQPHKHDYIESPSPSPIHTDKPTPLPNVSYTDTEIKLENGEYWLSTKLTNIEPGSSVVVAAYDNKGVLISIQIVKSTDSNINTQFTSNANIDFFKVFVFEEMDDIVPVTDSELVEI